MKLFYFLLFIIAFQVTGQEIETLAWKDLKVSGKIPLTISKSEFEQKYKKIDSIAVPLPGEICGDEETTDIRMLYYKGARYELNNGMLNFRSIDFTKRRNMYLSYKDDWFDHTTTLKYFKRAYPGAASYVEEFETADGRIMEMITFISEDDVDGCEWNFYFTDGKLESVECHFSCK